ncbi:HTH-type transcriptional regulator YodB [archaeon BMS3Abin16]|nr:HTH-type transcriptional regulator YodB [archaeon BMS3Abin16]
MILPDFSSSYSSDHGRLHHKGRVESLKGISPKTLSDRLKELEKKGIIERHSFQEISPRVEYSLTEKGAELGSALQGIVDWSDRWARM